MENASNRAELVLCEVCHTKGDFIEVFIEETLPVMGIAITNSHKYQKCNGCGELYEPFDNPDYNLLSDYQLFAEKKKEESTC